MTKSEFSTGVGFLAITFATLAAPAAAQNGASSTWPVNTFVAFATGDTLITLAAPGFESCQYDDEAYPFYGPEAEYFGPVPGMTFWSVQGVPSAPETNLHLIITPKGAVNVGWVMDVAVRVYRGPGIAEQFRSMKKCVFLRDGPLVARGIARYNMSDANDSLAAPGVNQWGWTLRGTLDNVEVDGCGGTVLLSMVRRWVVKSDPDVTVTKLTASKGPTLSCR
jgi:hypothetical protein